MLLKPNMVLPGKDAAQQASIAEVAAATLRCLCRAVPPAVRGVVFLSGGQSDMAATQHLNAMNLLDDVPWQLSFSYGPRLAASGTRSLAGEAGKYPRGPASVAAPRQMQQRGALRTV